jgi:hypothetical protein
MRRSLSSFCAGALAAATLLATTTEAGATAEPTSRSERDLNAISALAPGDVWAVGLYNTDGSWQPMSEHWDGSAWSRVRTPTLAGGGRLLGVSAVTSDDVWAVGEQIPFVDFEPLILHRNGSGWNEVAAPGAPLGGQLNAVAAVSADDVWAVGSRIVSADGDARSYVAHWDGTSWTRVHTPNGIARPRFTEINAVTALAKDDVWAVGWGFTRGDSFASFALHWDGRRWTRMSLPAPVGQTVYQSLSAASPNDIWAVGHYDNQGSQAITAHWDGSNWSQVDFPGLPSSALDGVAAASSDDVWAVGEYLTHTHPVILTPLVAHWDGTMWAQQEVAGGKANQSSLNAVGGASPSDLWTVGESGRKPLLRHWDGSGWR